jgi:DNA-directed RNA polymerase subunit M/transcription elongation factor TFIIS
LQLKRSESMLRQLLQQMGYRSKIEPFLIFVNPEFHLYQAPLNLPIVFPTQLNRFINKLITKSLKGKQSNFKDTQSKLKDRKLAEHLAALHISESHYRNCPYYTYEQLKRGITCISCQSFNVDYNEQKIVCKKCGYEEDVAASVIRSVKEFNLLFPDKKITTSAIHEWCKISLSRKTIQRILSENYKLMKHGRSSYFVKI